MTREKWSELHTLIDALLEGDLTEAQAERLNVWLAVDDEAQQVYLQSLDMHANLLWDHDREAVWPGEEIGSRPRAGDSLPSCNDSAAAEEFLAEARGSSAQVSRTELTPRSRAVERAATFSRNTIFACLAMMLAVVTVFGAERLISEVLLARRSTADQSGGMFASAVDERTLLHHRGTDAEIVQDHNSPGDEGKLLLYRGPNPELGTRRVGSSQNAGVGLASVFLFPLPAVDRIDGLLSARLEWTCITKDNNPTFAVDLYGLGYTREESFNGPCFWEGRQDKASAADYALEGRSERRVALIARRAITAATPCGRVVVENQALLEFLRSLYEDGAQEGDLAVFRLNADISTLKIERSTGYAIVHPPAIAGKTSPSDLPVLLMTFRSIQLSQ